MEMQALTRSLLSLLLDATAKGTVLLLVAWWATWFARRSSAAVRHSIWCLALGGMLVLPIASWALPAWQIPILPAEVIHVVEVAPAPEIEPPSVAVEALPAPVVRPRPTTTPSHSFPQQKAPALASSPPPVVVAAPSPPEPEPVVAPAPAASLIEVTSKIVASVWSVGVLLFGILLLVGLWHTLQLRRASQTVSDGVWPELLGTLRERLQLQRSAELREHRQSVVPLTWGIWRPVVLLPQLAREWTETMRRAVLLHELAHVQRRDVASQLLGRLTCVVYWFHPLVWFALRQLRQEREQACDDAVVHSGEKASDYAEQLLAVAKLCRGPGGLSLGVAMAEGTSLERRVISLFDSARSHGPLTKRVALASLLIGGAILAGLASIQPTAAESEPAIQADQKRDDDVKVASQRVNGVVVDSQDQPVAGAVVWCDVDQDKATRQPVTVRVETNAQGEFTFTVPKSSLDFGQGHFQHAAWAWKPGHGIGVGVAVATTRMPKNPTARLHLPETAAVALQVVDEKGQPLAGAEVTPDRVQASQVPSMPQDGSFSLLVHPPKELLAMATRKTDAEGRVTLDLVPRRFLNSVQVTTASHGSQSFSEYLEVLILGAVTSVEGELSSHQAGVRLSLTTYQTRPQTEKPGPREVLRASVQVVTDAQGRFSVPVIPMGEYTVASAELNGPQFLSASTAQGVLVAGSNKLALEVITGIPVKGRVVVRGENKGVANAALHVTTHKDFESGAVVQTLCQTNENGEYSSFTLPGHYVSSEIASLGSDETLIHPQMSSYPPTFQRPPQLASDAKEAVIPEIVVDRGQAWLGTLVDEQQAPIVGAFVVPLRNGKQLTAPFPTGQEGRFGFLLLKGVTPEAWHLVVQPDEPYAPTLPLQVVTKEPLVLRTQRATIPQADPDQPKQSWNPIEEYTGGFSPEEIEEAQVTAEIKDVLTKAGLTVDEQAQLDQVAADELVGVVLDAATRQPVEGVTIEFMCRSPKSNSTTSKLGLFRVAGFAPQEPAFVIVRKSGFAPRFFMRPPGGTGWVILLDNRTYFEGTITDLQGQPVAGATVRATWESAISENPHEGGMPMDTETTSLADGTYRLCVPGITAFESQHADSPGHDIQVIAPGRGSIREKENYIASRTAVPLSFQLQAPANFVAQIVDSETGAPVPDYVLYTVDKPFRIGRSDAEGRLVIDDMTPGNVMFYTGEGEGKDDPDCVGCEGSQRFDQVAYARWWSPDVRKDRDSPYFGQLVLPQEGKFHGNFDLLHFDIQPGMAPAKVFVERSVKISGRVTDPDGQPVAGATVVPARNGSSLTGDTRYSVKTDEDGRYVLHIPASKNSTYNLLAHDGGHDQWRSWANGVNAPFQTTPGQTLENVDLQLTRPGRVTGRVIRKGQPVANYLVRTVSSDLQEHSYYNPQTKTNADGTFELTHVRPGKQFLQVGFYQYGKDGDQGPEIEVVAGEVIADQLLEAKEQRDPEEGAVKPPEPEPTLAEAAPTPAGTPPVDIAAQPMAQQPAPAGAKTIRGQVVNDRKQPLAGAEVVLVLETPNDTSQPGQVAATATTDADGQYTLNLPPTIAASKSFGAIWARAKGHTIVREHWSSIIPALSDRKGPLTLTATSGTTVQVLDQLGKPLEEVRIHASRISIPEGVGYALPTGWEDQASAVTNARGDANLVAVTPGSIQGLTLIPPDEISELQFGRNYFLNIRPSTQGRNFSFRLPEMGAVEGQLQIAAGQKLPENLMLTVRSCSLELPQFDGVVRVPVDPDGRFHIERIPVGQLIVPLFLPADQPLRAVVPPHVEVQPGKTAKLEIAVAPGVPVSGKVVRSDTQTGFAKYPVTILFGQSITNKRVDCERQAIELLTDDEGAFACLLPPGPIEVLTSEHRDGYQRASSWLPEDKRGMWGGVRFGVQTSSEVLELEPIALSKSVSLSGKLIDQNQAVVEGWMVYGYPEVASIEPSSTMNSFAGVRTQKNGHFDGTYPDPYAPVRWEVSHRVWKTKYEFDDIKYKAVVLKQKPLLLQVDTTKPLER